MIERLLQAALAAALCVSASSAGTFAVDPVQVVIDDDRRTAAVRVTNQGSAPSTVRISPQAWRQVDGNDVREITRDLIASPPIATIAPGATQVVRLGFRNPGRHSGTYRLVVEETPERSASGVKVALRLDLPVFARVESTDAGVLRWSAFRDPRGQWVVEAENSSRGYVRLAPPDFTSGTGLRFDSSVALGVVLPQSSRRWIMNSTPEVANAIRWASISKEGGNARRDLASKAY